MIQRIFLALLCVGLCALTVLGDTVKLNDGTSIKGLVLDQGEKYWIKDSDGETHLVDKSAVVSITKDSAEAAPSAGATAAAPRPTVYAGSGGFAAVKSRADLSDNSVAAVAIWQSYIDSKPAAADLAQAKLEMQHWQDVVDGKGEKINGKWIWGADRDKLIKQVRQLMLEGTEDLRNNQTLIGISKLEDAVKLYPNNFEGNFELGYYNLVKGAETHSNAKIDAGIKSLETASKVRPDCAAALSDLAIGYSFRQKYQLSVETAYKAAKIEDSKEIVQNLVNSIAFAPPGMQNNTKVKPIMEETVVLAKKYGISSQSSQWAWVRPHADSKPKIDEGSGGDDEEGKTGPPGIFAEGTGFFIASNGYIMTNRHVAKPGDYLMVRMPDNSIKLAQRVVIDDEQDMAVIKIDVTDPVPFIRLAGYDHPPVGADVAVFGFPLLDRFGLKSSVKMTRGIVTAWDQGNELCDVTVDAIVNPGNSGGPMVDHHGNLLAITAMKTIADTGMVTTYGLGYSTERVRKFFLRQKDKLTAAKLESGKDDGPVLSNEELATKLTPATVCILMCRGTPPSVGGNGTVKLKKQDTGE